ncbi:MAG TPA: 50S ribosomal protein L25 [Thermomicrobiales bacterium]|nr:50S ribosomal protein L25 [Thermomicrobiales bacterium]
MAGQEFAAQRRTVVGKKVRQLRREGRVPGIVYGPVVAGTVPVSVDRREFLKFYQANGHSTLFVLRWEDGDQSVFIREVQQDPVRREPLHVDFFAPNLRRPVRATVPVALHNQSNAIDGALVEIRTEIEVEALPASIPHQIDIDIAELVHPGDAIRVGDLTMPDGVTAVTGEGETIVQVEAVYQEPEEVAEEVAEAAPADVPVEESPAAEEAE